MKIVRGTLFALIAGGCAWWFSGVCRHKGTLELSVERFLRETNRTYDVLAFGPSYVFCTFNPSELYRASGLRSRVIGSSAQPIEATYYHLENALRRFSPKVVVVGASTLFKSEAQGALREEYLHNATDTIPFGPLKCRMMADLPIEDSVENYLIPFLKYHMRWKSLGKADFCGQALSGPPEHLGYALHVACRANDIKPVALETVKPSPLGAAYLAYLDRFVSLAAEHHVELVFLIAPRKDCVNGRYRTFRETLDRRGIRYIDLNHDFAKVGFDNSRDFKDFQHLNVFGAEKATRYIGKYLEKNFRFSKASADDAIWWKEQICHYDRLKARELKAAGLDKSR